MLGRRKFLGGWAHLTAVAWLSPACYSHGGPHLSERIDSAIALGVRYLANRQAPDGAWRSDIYGPFKDGPSLTSLIAAKLSLLPDNPAAARVSERALRFLAGVIKADGSVNSDHGHIAYPVYTAAGAVIALSGRDSSYSDARDTWLKYLIERQLTEELGWKPSHEAFGGWSYAHDRPQPVNGRPPTPLAAPNVSATIFALEALIAAGVTAKDPAVQKSLLFVKRCQNWIDTAETRDPDFDDGGFYFIVEDPQRNKAGIVGTDASGRIRYASYGSATADGLRALIACGLEKNHPRIVAARRWLEEHYSASSHPGGYTAERRHMKEAVFYYYCASATKAFIALGIQGDWAADMANTLLGHQREDGSWANNVVDVREDDPLVATPFCLQALCFCRIARLI
jgi:squalene-hopene/tetraprenyl-beta-curcumene cyclase